MIIYNVTIKVDQAIKEDWLRWLKEEHVPEVVSTGCFTNANILQILEIDDSEGPTYAVQYFANSFSEYERYINKHAGIFREKSIQKWAGQFIAFRSVMQVVN